MERCTKAEDKGLGFYKNLVMGEFGETPHYLFLQDDYIICSVTNTATGHLVAAFMPTRKFDPWLSFLTFVFKVTGPYDCKDAF